MIITVNTLEEIRAARRMVHAHADQTVQALQSLSETSVDFLAKLKFGKIGLHPLEDRPLNFVEHLNQTFTYLVALKAAELLLEWHPECEGLHLAPGAHTPKGSLDIESKRPGLIGAETFAAMRYTQAAMVSFARTSESCPSALRPTAILSLPPRYMPRQ